MAKSRKLEVLITGNAKQAQQALGQLDGSARKSESALSKLGKAAAGLAVGATLYSAAKDAASLAEAQSKVGAVFGDSAKEVQDFADGAANALGQSEEQALSAVGTYGNLLTSFGLAKDEAGEMSIAMTELASDLASFNDTSVEDAIDALRSGLSGETEPLKRYGIALDDASLKAAALAQGIYDGTGVLEPAAKAQAAYTLIMERSTNAQGDFARTQDSASNQVKIAEANYKDAKAALGESLLPVMTKAAAAASTLAEGFQQIPEPVVTGALAIGGLAKIIAVGSAAVEMGSKFASASSTMAKNALVPTKAIEGLGSASDQTAAASRNLGRSMGAAAVGVGAFAATLALLNEASDFDGSLDDLGTDLTNYAAGAVDLNTALGETGRTTEDLAAAFELNAQKADTYFGALKQSNFGADVAGAMDMRQAASDIGAIDDALAGMVKSGNAEQARQAYGKLAAEMIQAGVPAEEVASAMNDYWDQVDRAEQTGAAASITGVADATGDVADATEDAAGEAETYADKLEKVKKEADDATKAIEEFFGAQTDSTGSKIEAERALDDLTESIREHGLALSIDGEAGRTNRESIIAARDAALDYAMTIREQTGSSQQAADAMHQYAGSLRQTLLDGGFTEDQVASLIAEMGLTPTDINTTFHENATLAETNVGLMNEEIGRILPGKSVDIQVQTEQAMGNLGVLQGALAGVLGMMDLLGRGPAGTSQGGSRGTGLASRLPLPGRASGGPVKAGFLYEVNERGQELFSPNVDGTIIPAGPTAAMFNAGNRRTQLYGHKAGAAPTIVLNVAGSVLAERDLVESVRVGLDRSFKRRNGFDNPFSA